MHLEYFQMIDNIVSVNDDTSQLVATSKVPKTSPVFEGHFPGHPLVPGVLLIETMAQASGYLIMARLNFERMPFLAGVKEGKLRTFVEPQSVLEITADIEHDGSGFAMTKGSIRSQGKKICDAALTFKTLDFPDPSLKDMIVGQAKNAGMPTDRIAP